MKHRYSSFLSPIHIIVDTLCLNFSFLLSYYLKFNNIDQISKYPYIILFLLVNLIWVALLVITIPYRASRINSSINQALTSLLTTIALHAAITAFYWFATQAYYYSRIQLMGMYLIFFSFGLVWRVLFIWAIRQYRLQGFNIRKYIILGAGDLSSLIIKYHESHPELGYQYDGYFGSVDKYLQLWRGDYENAKQYIENNNIDYIYCYLPKLDNQYLHEIIKQTRKIGCEVKILMDFNGFISNKVNIEYHDFIPVVNVSNNFFEDYKINFFKRSFDIIFSIIALIAGSPLFIIIAITTKLTSKGPVLYSQERVGLLGSSFKIYKFRSMYINSEQNGPALSSGKTDFRITPWGHFMRKTRLDELPQFWNVLIGDMSVVGPRPERQYFIDQIVQIAPEYVNLLKIKPGITSIGQVKYGYASDITEMIERMNYDLTYRPSLQQDIQLISLTLKVMVLGKGK
jgi:putative colanic acid biosynthesis UDP-glucose lipid carrier transferase